MTFKIQRGVPIPATTRDPATVQRKYPYADLGVSDFFFVPHKDKNTLSSHASAAGKTLGRNFITRLTFAVELEDGSWLLDDVTAETEDAVQGIGVWRAADDTPAEAAFKSIAAAKRRAALAAKNGTAEAGDEDDE
jgi:hypothetical protein